MSKNRIGSIKDYTPNFKMIIPRFDLATWHDYIEENFRNIDALFFNLFGINNYSGPWKQITSYKEGQVLFIPDDRDINGEETIYAGRLVKVLVDHVTDNSDYFNFFYNLHPEYYELFADAGAAQIFAQQAQDASKEAKNSENVIIQKQIEINDTISEFNDNVATKTEELSQQIAEGIEVIEENAQIAVDNAEKSRIFAIGEQEEVETLAPDMLSSRGFANLSMAIANAPVDVPIDESNILALDVIKGPKGDKGDPGEDGKDGGGLEVGDIAPTVFGIDETKNLRRYLNGQVISQTQFETFTKIIKERAELYPNIVTTEENWQTEITNSVLGQCGKFVIDDTLGTIRLPKVININGLQNLSLMGSIKAESLPSFNYNYPINHTGYPNGSSDSGNGEAYNQAYWRGWNEETYTDNIYQDNAPVQQEAIQYPYFIQVATGVEESVDVTREIELNNPFFFGMSQYFESDPNNASWLISNGSFYSGTVYVNFYKWLLKIYNGTEIVDGISVKASTDIYNDYDYVINTKEISFRLPNRSKDDFIIESKLATTDDPTWYRVYKSGWVEQGGTTSAVPRAGLTINLNKVMADQNFTVTAICKYANVQNEYSITIIPLSNSSFSIKLGSYNGGQPNFPCYWQLSGQGAETSISKTYFYVGETIQDANVISASQVLTRIAELSNEYITSLGMPDYSAGIDITTTLYNNKNYTAPIKGVLFNAMIPTNDTEIKINGYSIGIRKYSTYGNWIPTPYYLNTGDIFSVSGWITSDGGAYFFPLKGAN